MEDNIVTYVEVSSGIVAMVRLCWFHRGCELWYVSRETHLNSGGLSTSHQKGSDSQLTEGIAKGRQESDSFIVLGDGKADHMGKGRTVRLIEQRTDASGMLVLNKSVSSSLLEMKDKVRLESKYWFNTLYRKSRTMNPCRYPLRDLIEEPYAGKPHVGICEGAGQQWPVLP